MKKRSHRLEKMARVYDAEILPIWSERFGRMLLRDLKIPAKAMVLDMGCGTGYPALEILERMGPNGRIVALEGVGALLDVARKKAGDLNGKRIFFRTEAPSTSLGFADEVYDIALSNLGLLDTNDPQRTLQELARVTKTDGRVIATMPLAGTYAEFYDIYREVLTRSDQHELLVQLEQHIGKYPEADEAARWMERAGLKHVKAEVETFRLLFNSSREFFFAPVIEYGPLPAWKEIAGKGQQMQDIFWRIKEAIDCYFGGTSFEVTVRAGCLSGIRPEKLETEEPVVLEPPTNVADALEEVTKSGFITLDDSNIEMINSGLVHEDSMVGEDESFPGEESALSNPTLRESDDDPDQDITNPRAEITGE